MSAKKDGSRCYGCFAQTTATILGNFEEHEFGLKESADK
jgi:hypothetical protein